MTYYGLHLEQADIKQLIRLPPVYTDFTGRDRLTGSDSVTIIWFQHDIQIHFIHTESIRSCNL